MRTPDDLRAAASRAGLELVGVERVPMPGGMPGETTLAARFRFKDPWAAARLLADLSEEDASDPIVRAWALSILKASAAQTGTSLSGPTVSPALRQLATRAVHANVQRQIRFVPEPRETFQAARVTMRAGAGDCDDHARLVHALVRAMGQPSRLTFFSQDRQPVHVTARVGPERVWSETTIGAMFGEHPYAAYRRLRASGALERPELE